jgi:hypothetical protein
MFIFAKIRRNLHLMIAVLVLATTTVAFAGPPRVSRPAFGRSMEREAGQRQEWQGQRSQGSRPESQEHLGQWMSRHSNLPLDQQQRALENEPGFRQLPSQTQQHLRNRLTQLNSMSPQQRQRFIERNEAMERLTPPQRDQVRGAMQQLGGLPQDSRRRVAHAFRDLREMSPAQRQDALNSGRFRDQLSEQERGTLSNLLSVEPYLPPPHYLHPMPAP